ncbi:hypothetical protein [Bacillus sp. FJAT-29814]|uniref:hypothetical protein n=1 Tax=Bacillus sp. FJAT-29814 TaxID=1729688 RepID=UPI0012E35C92|nr:hypothetical protein [Bacillus sp. FJAT-29814]
MELGKAAEKVQRPFEIPFQKVPKQNEFPLSLTLLEPFAILIALFPLPQLSGTILFPRQFPRIIDIGSF